MKVKGIFLETFTISVIVTSIFLIKIIPKSGKKLHVNYGLDEYEIMEKHGYPYEKHYVTTEDGYILEISRVLPRLAQNSTRNNFNSKNSTEIPFKIYPELLAKQLGEPILLMHGFTVHGKVYVAHDPDKALAFILVNHGYDVYLGNARGTPRSKRHIDLDPQRDAKEFWDFSQHEIGVYDQPAIVNYILNLTKFDQLSYVGISQGGSTYLIMAAEKPEINSKIKVAVSFAGITGMKYTPSKIFKVLSSFEQQLQWIYQKLRVYQFMESGVETMQTLTYIDEYYLRGVINFMMNFLSILTTDNIDEEIYTTMLNPYPSSCSMNQMLHFMQCARHGDFRKFDYVDKTRNLAMYGSEFPPEYNLTAITSKVLLYYSDSDYLVGSKDTSRSAEKMPNAIMIGSQLQQFCHGDYLFARDVVNLVFVDVLSRIRNA